MKQTTDRKVTKEGVYVCTCMFVCVGAVCNVMLLLQRMQVDQRGHI